MHHAGTAIEPAFYDHEDDAVQGSERQAPDWGADEVFATVPRRRIRGERSLSGAQTAMRPRTGVTSRRSDLHDAPSPQYATQAVLLDLPVEPTPTGADALLLSPDGSTVNADAPMVSADALIAGVEIAPPATAWTHEPEPAGRRTVVVTGRPEGAPPQPRAMVVDRRRPSRSVTEHVGGRPDRVAGWAFGMGLLLIAVASFT